MPSWLVASLPFIARAPSIALGLMHLAQAISTEMASGDSTMDKAVSMATTLADNMPEIEGAVRANTPAA